MTQQTESKEANLLSALMEEVSRVTEVSATYRQYGLSFIAALVIDADLKVAKQAIETKDTTKMLQMLQELQGWKL